MELRESRIINRISWIDNCKALAISLVALGHVQSIYLVNVNRFVPWLVGKKTVREKMRSV